VTHYILQQPAKCPNCKSEVLEETLVVTAIFILTSCVLLAVQKLQPNTVGKWEAAELIRPQKLSIQLRDNGPSKPLIVFVGIRLLVAQRHQWIHFGGTSGGHITGEGGDCDEHRGDGSHGHRIVRADVV
jgi:hypothetical protein